MDEKPKKPRGGSRQKSGRKKIAPEDKKRAVVIYLTSAEIDKMGGEERIKTLMVLFLRENFLSNPPA